MAPQNVIVTVTCETPTVATVVRTALSGIALADYNGATSTYKASAFSVLSASSSNPGGSMYSSSAAGVATSSLNPLLGLAVAAAAMRLALQ